MQAPTHQQTGPPKNRPYTAVVARRMTKKRPAQGQRLQALRKAAGFSQVELAEQIGETQQNVAYWEQSERPPRADVLPKMAKALGVSVEVLLNIDVEPTTHRRKGPIGKTQKVFEEVAQLHRRQQDKIVDVIAAMV